MCVFATHSMERNHPQNIAVASASHAACRAIIGTGRNGRRGSMRLKTRLLPMPETSTQATAATGNSQRNTASKYGA